MQGADASDEALPGAHWTGKAQHGRRRLPGVRTGCLAGGPGPAAETALGAFRRALEGTLASAGALTRRIEPDALLSLGAAPGISGLRMAVRGDSRGGGYGGGHGRTWPTVRPAHAAPAWLSPQTAVSFFPPCATFSGTRTSETPRGAPVLLFRRLGPSGLLPIGPGRAGVGGALWIRFTGGAT